MNKPLSKFVLDTFKAPNFVYGFQKGQNKVRQRLHSKLGLPTTVDKYKESMDNLDSFVLMSWVPQDINLDRDFFWSSFTKDHGKGVYFQDPINNNLFQTIVDECFLDKRLEYRAWSQISLDIDSMNKVLYSTKRDDSKIMVKCVGINANARQKNTNVANYIQLLVNDSTEDYKNIDYQKLLQIAKDNESHSSLDNAFKQLLANLADLELSYPNLVYNDKWLLFTKTIGEREEYWVPNPNIFNRS